MKKIKNKQTILEDTGSKKTFHCYHCKSKEKSLKRNFSMAAWNELIAWNEVKNDTVEKPICDTCYKELRSILIEKEDKFKKLITPDNIKSRTNFVPEKTIF